MFAKRASRLSPPLMSVLWAPSLANERVTAAEVQTAVVSERTNVGCNRRGVRWALRTARRMRTGHTHC